MNSIYAKFLLITPLILCAPVLPSTVDSDRDGISDKFEQQLLQKFVPRFHLSSRECNGFPAEFQAGSKEPRPSKSNGTIYGQVFPVALPNRAGFHIEVHFYHLWNRDCGLNGHTLDAEHVSALLSAQREVADPEAWMAVYWYAGVHEDTVCDASHGVRSSFVNAEQQGPNVWISEGKHASFLSLDLCRGGCGGDQCTDMHPMLIANLLNIGESGAPMNGAVWIDSPKWPLAAKMRSDFTEAALQKIERAESPGVIAVHEAHAPLKAVVLAGSSGTGALVNADSKAFGSLASARNATGRSLNTSKKNVGDSIKGAFRSAWKVLSGSSNN